MIVTLALWDFLGVTMTADIVLIVFCAVLVLGFSAITIVRMADLLECQQSDGRLPVWDVAWVNRALTHRWVRIAALVTAPVIFVIFGISLIVMLFWMIIEELPDTVSETVSSVRNIIRR